MDAEELFEYIKNRKYMCYLCMDVQKEIIKNGLAAIEQYEGIICGSIEDMQIRYAEINKGRDILPPEDAAGNGYT